MRETNEGYFKFLHCDGSIKQKGNWKNGKEIGEHKYYYENGKMSMRRNHNDKGQIHGTQIRYKLNGTIETTNHYENGNLI